VVHDPTHDVHSCFLFALYGSTYAHSRRVCLRTPTAPAQVSERCSASFLHRPNEDSVARACDDLDSPLCSLQALCHLPTTSQWVLRGGASPLRARTACRGTHGRDASGCHLRGGMGRAVKETALRVGCGRRPCVQRGGARHEGAVCNVRWVSLRLGVCRLLTTSGRGSDAPSGGRHA